MQTESLTLKSTPAAKIFMRLVAAFNTGNPQRIADFVANNYAEDILAEYTVDEIVDWYLDLYDASGGVTIHKVYMSQERYLIVIVENKGDGQTYIDKLKITAENKVIEYLHEPAP